MFSKRESLLNPCKYIVQLMFKVHFLLVIVDVSQFAYNIIIFTEIIKQKQFPLLFLTTLYLFPLFVTQSEKGIHKQGLDSFYLHIVNNSVGLKTKSHGCLVNKPLILLD